MCSPGVLSVTNCACGGVAENFMLGYKYQIMQSDHMVMKNSIRAASGHPTSYQHTRGFRNCTVHRHNITRYSACC